MRQTITLYYTDFVANALISKLYYKREKVVTSMELLNYLPKVINNLKNNNISVCLILNSNFTDIDKEYFHLLRRGEEKAFLLRSDKTIDDLITNYRQGYFESLGMCFVEPEVLETLGINQFNSSSIDTVQIKEKTIKDG